MTMQGLDIVLRNLNKEISNIDADVTKSLVESCLVVKEDAAKIAPVDTGNLRASSFIKVTGFNLPEKVSFVGEDAGQLQMSHSKAVAQAKSIVGNRKYSKIGVIAFSAFYAWFVHEAPMKLKGIDRPVPRGKKKGSRGKFWDPQGQAGNKFLMKSLLKNTNRILKIFEKNLKR